MLPWFRSNESFAGGADALRGSSESIGVQTYRDNHPVEEAFLKASAQAGHGRAVDNNGTNEDGAVPFDANISGGWRSGTARECVAVAARRPDVTMLTGPM